MHNTELGRVRKTLIHGMCGKGFTRWTPTGVVVEMTQDVSCIGIANRVSYRM